MGALFDDLARLVAIPMPRRQACRLIGGTLVGSLVTGLWPGRVWAVKNCGGYTCGDNDDCCPAAQSGSGTCCTPHDLLPGVLGAAVLFSYAAL